MSNQQDIAFGLCYQNSYGTVLTSSMHWMEITEEDISRKKEPLMKQGMRSIFDEGATKEGINSNDGGFSIEAHPISIGVMLEAIMAGTHVTSSGVYTHTYKPNTTDFDKFAANVPCTIHKDMSDGGSAFLLYDMVAGELEFNINNSELATVKLGFMGGKYSDIAAITPAYPDDDVIFGWDVTSMQLGASAIEEISQLTVKMSEALANKYTLSSASGKNPNRTKRDGWRTFEVSGTILFDDQTEYRQFLAQSEREMIIHMQGSTEIQSGYSESLTITLPKFRYTELPVNAGGAGQQEVSFSGKAVYHVGSATAMAVTLVNTFAAYR